jgi:hypothetical protein
MANELKLDGYTASQTVYALVENTAGQMWRTDTFAFETYNESNWPKYAVTMSQVGSTGRYRGNFPTSIVTPGKYFLSIYSNGGGSATTSDTYAGSTDIEWRGSYELTATATPIDLTQGIPTTNTAQTVGDALNAARAQGFGKWVLNGTTFNLYASDGNTIVRSFTLDNPTSPTQRA